MSHSTKQKKKHIKAVQPKLRVFRAKEPLLSVFMWGINHSINELMHVNIPVMLMPDDFKSHSKVRVDNHLFNKDNMPSHFKFKEYCPLVFRNLRERFDIDEDTYGNSLTKFCPSENEASARSSSRFLMSWDQKFVVKTIMSEQVAEMHRIMKEYHQHIVERHSETLLPQYMGMYRVTVNDNETYLLVMRNIFSPRLDIHRKYDLKGSTVDRQASEKEKSKDLPTYKDNDFMNDGMDIHIGAEAKDRILLTIQADIDFLCKQNLMDYSLLVGIHDLDKAEEELNESGEEEENGYEEGGPEDDSGDDPAIGGVPTPPDSPACLISQPSFTGEIDPSIERFGLKCSEDCPRKEVYFLALVDILTHYGVKKRTAQAAKTVKHGAGAEISTVKPEQYAKRFMDFVSRIFS